jgi:hypothetical protein
MVRKGDRRKNIGCETTTMSGLAIEGSRVV